MSVQFQELLHNGVHVHSLVPRPLRGNMLGNVNIRHEVINFIFMQLLFYVRVHVRFYLRHAKNNAWPVSGAYELPVTLWMAHKLLLVLTVHVHAYHIQVIVPIYPTLQHILWERILLSSMGF